MYLSYKGGPENGPTFCEAAAFWRWSNCVHSLAPAAKRRLLVNMDETSVRLHQSPADGHLVQSAVMQKQLPKSLLQDVSTGSLRGCMTLVAFVCNDPDVQRCLPQVLLASRALVSNDTEAKLKTILPENVLLWRGAKAWVTSAVMVRLMGVLHARLRRVARESQVILYMDSFRAHWTIETLLAMHRCGFVCCVVPAKLTWVLQPLDSHIFSLFKHSLRIRCQMRQTQKANGKLDAEVLVRSMCESVAEILLGQCWNQAFVHSGLDGGQTGVSRRVLAQLGLDSVPAIPHGMPDLRQLRTCFPARSRIPIDCLFAPFVPEWQHGLRAERPTALERLGATASPTGICHGPLLSTERVGPPSSAAASSHAWPHGPTMSAAVPLSPAGRDVPRARPLPGNRYYVAGANAAKTPGAAVPENEEETSTLQDPGRGSGGKGGQAEQ